MSDSEDLRDVMADLKLVIAEWRLWQIRWTVVFWLGMNVILVVLLASHFAER